MLKTELNTEEVISRAGDVMTQKPVKIEITFRPKNWLQKFFITIKCISNKRIFNLSPIVVGNMMRIASKVVLIPADILKKDINTAVFEGLVEHGDDIVYCIACALQNNHKEPSESLIQLIKNEFTASDLANVFGNILSQMHAQDFIKSIILLKGMNVLNAQEEDATPASLPE